VAVVDQLQRDDRAYQREFKKLYGPGLRSLAKGRLPLALSGSPGWRTHEISVPRREDDPALPGLTRGYAAE
jgi:hypothetical protein